MYAETESSMDLTWSRPQSMGAFGREQYRMIAFVRQMDHLGKLGFLQKSFAHLLPVKHEFPAVSVEPVECTRVMH